MTLRGTIVMELDPAPTPEVLERIRVQLEELLDSVENEVAGALWDAGAGFAAETFAVVEL